MKFIQLFLIGLLVVGSVLCDSGDMTDSGSMAGSDNDDGSTTVNYNETITINGETTNKQFTWTGSSLQYSSDSDFSVRYDENVSSTNFSYTIIRDDDCDSSEDSGIVIKHTGKTGKLHTINVHNFTCFENNSRPTIDIQPDDGEIRCTETKIPNGGRIDCSYEGDLSEPGYLNMTLNGVDSLTTYNTSQLRQIISQFFNIPMNRVNVTAMSLRNNMTLLRIDVGPAPSSSPNANSVLAGMTLQRLIDAKVVKEGTQSPSSTVVVVVTEKPRHNGATRFFSCPYHHYLEGCLIASLFLFLLI